MDRPTTKNTGSFNNTNQISLNAFCYYLPFEKGMVLRFNKFKSTLSKDTLCQVWLKLVTGSWEENEMWKVNSRTDRRTTCDQESWLELSAQAS